jgi:SAM-dependent methyltransferase
MATAAALDPYDHALRDYFFSDRTDATLTLYSDLGEHDALPVDIFFREPEAFFPFERVALDHCRGTVLDVGAGTGVDTLALQQRDFTVHAVEITRAGVEIMRRRGVRTVTQGDIRELQLPPVDTMLMMMNGIGFVETLDGLDQFLPRAAELLKPRGQLLVDSGQAHLREDSVAVPGLQWPPRAGDYLGEAWVCLEYAGQRGEPFRELYIDFTTLTRHAAAAGWLTEQLVDLGSGSYVARLTKLDAS